MNEKLITAINNQVTNEHQAAMIYTQLGYEMDDLSFPGMRDWFMAQAEEEREHAQKFADHLLARGYRVELGDITMPSLKAATPLDAFEASYANEQIEEEDTVSEIIDQIKLVGNDGAGLLRIDRSLSSRQPAIDA